MLALDVFHSINYLTIYSQNACYALGALLQASSEMENVVDKRPRVGTSAEKKKKGSFQGMLGACLRQGDEGRWHSL